jgi:hypothetical protein
LDGIKSPELSRQTVGTDEIAGRGEMRVEHPDGAQEPLADIGLKAALQVPILGGRN